MLDTPFAVHPLMYGMGIFLFMSDVSDMIKYVCSLCHDAMHEVTALPDIWYIPIYILLQRGNV
ncbi:hypothetical protein Spico_0475 [Parasphaerochaeta coccoides DSM 17374]|uniref:Uncharacterized protein n=1 Tax=Parasphaerochaeta coccoides (strain ATCC BAA-1237 / DSM 17374 / SPN1) TaxID=760011 RepID=F4GJ63_PARC1|nr:hypothetical protein Spico_0475 [Parasphaerochaeta coccoides DSM 17374]